MASNLRLQFATSREGHGGRRSLPYAFTEHGAIMAATVLNSKEAVEIERFRGTGICTSARDAGGKQSFR
jgi:hypothetical protein